MKLHLGCGKRDFEGWINVDLADFPHVHYKSSVDDLKMFKDNTADLIYSSHTLEYFDKLEVVTVLKEWHRVLKDGATLRVAVPNFNALAKLKILSLILCLCVWISCNRIPYFLRFLIDNSPREMQFGSHSTHLA